MVKNAMDDESYLVNTSMEMIERMRHRNDNATYASLARYLKIIPDPLIKGMAQHKARQHLKQRGAGAALNAAEKTVLAAQISQQILNELIQKTRRRSGSELNEDLDGAELFYRRALNHIGMERYGDAERLLRRAVEICPDFVDAWSVLVEVFEHNGKAELAAKAKLRLRELQSGI